MAISVYRPSFGVLFWTRSFRLKSSSRIFFFGSDLSPLVPTNHPLSSSYGLQFYHSSLLSFEIAS